jgi:diguanylate cyclase (GGDEF)-like protein
MSDPESKTPHTAESTPRKLETAFPACVVEIYGGRLGRKHEFGAADITVGREPDSTVALDLATVSRHHARLFQLHDRFFVEDLESTNGTLVNGARIGGVAPLRNGDLVQTGEAVLKFIEGGNLEAQYHEEIYRLTISDGLTGLANKRYLLEFLEREASRARRHARPLCFAIADIDHFKRVNDSHGHLAGDKVLEAVARVFRAEIRQDELAARYGGEEFAFVLPETDLAGGRAFCDRVRLAVEASEIGLEAQRLRVTLSLGLAPFQPDDDSEALIARADARLYAAKQAGRNRVAF